MFDQFVEFGQGVIGDQRKHVVFEVVVHVPVEVAVDGVHIDGAAVKAMVKDVFGETSMLGRTIN